jgi:hypothetical protein
MGFPLEDLMYAAAIPERTASRTSAAKRSSSISPGREIQDYMGLHNIFFNENGLWDKRRTHFQISFFAPFQLEKCCLTS